MQTTSGSVIEGRTYIEIPAATEPCTPAECEWWNRFRETGNKLLRKGDQKSKNSYVSLFVEGIAKSYKIPLKDHRAQVLVYGPKVQTTFLAPKERNGTIKLSIELRSDASIGDVSVLQGIGPEINKRCIKAAQSIIFLPAVKEGKFVADFQTPEYKFFHSAFAH